MKKILKIFFIIVLVIFIKFLSTYLVNLFIINQYNDNTYNSNIVKYLYFINIDKPYIAYYNDGNINYQKGNYDKALSKYRKALDKNPPIKEKCDIRVNMSLSIIKTINENGSKESIISELNEALNNLYLDHCADPKDESGVSKEAEKLEEEIKELLKEQENSDPDNNNQPNNPNNSPSENNDPDESIEEQLREREREANEARQNGLSSYENSHNYQYYTGPTW